MFFLEKLWKMWEIGPKVTLQMGMGGRMKKRGLHEQDINILIFSGARSGKVVGFNSEEHLW
jgi:hypothetical protein